jgi:hypothetical protein
MKRCDALRGCVARPRGTVALYQHSGDQDLARSSCITCTVITGIGHIIVAEI